MYRDQPSRGSNQGGQGDAHPLDVVRLDVLLLHDGVHLWTGAVHHNWEEPDLCIGENEPYGGHLPGDAIARHAIAYERPNVLLEVRNDLIEEEADQLAWGRRLAPLLEDAAETAGV